MGTKLKDKKRAKIKDLARALEIHMDVHQYRENFHPNQLAKRFGVSIGHIRSAFRLLVAEGKARQPFRESYVWGKRPMGWMHHIFSRRVDNR